MINLPSYVKNAICILEKNGYEAYVVGGCVRDSLLGRTPYDWDICTSALPEETVKCFSDCKTDEIGKAYGTIRVYFEDNVLEITTYRIEKAYLDNRHPEIIEFSKELKDDLSRRDFTINALCYNEKEGIIDIFDGLSDLKNRKIRTIGDANVRFTEDALRIMRAIRFSSKLGFFVEEKTEKAIFENAHLLKNLPHELIERELLMMTEYENGKEVIKKYIDVILKNPPRITEGKRNIKKWKEKLGEEVYNMLIK